MNVHQFLLILLARKKIILSTLLVTVALALGWSLIQSKTYKATASVLLNYKGVDPLTGLTMPGQLLPGYMATQIDIISSKNVALRVVDALHLASSPAVIQQFNEANEGRGSVRDWLADLLLKKLEIVPSRESSVVEISFKGADPAFSAAVANAFADEYEKITVQLKTQPAKKASSYFNEQTKQLRDNLEAAQARLSKYQQEKGIVSLDNNRVDVELQRLNELSAQLVQAQAAAMEGNSRQAAAGSALSSPDVANNALIQQMRANLATAEGKFADTSQRYGKNHPQYMAAKAELDKVRGELNAALGTVSRSVGANAQVMRQRESELREAVAQQKAKVLELNRARDELGVLLKDLDSAQRAFDAASQRFSQTRIEAQSEQSDISLLNPAVPPTQPSGPRVLLNTLVGILAGTVLGVGLALLLELLNRPVRSPSDVKDMLGIPVLGTIEWKPARARAGGIRSLMTPRRLLRLN
ncbi:chain-length determining protein [Massilia sp. WF1]|uniref:chain length determinant protein EpsF n=1 Tax=unclassified Massilia TaxID=2609279 RepID=UPI00064A9CB5|nr:MULTISPECIES: chain length determinant protein EpsF [unclassified Massilia]ALK96333.1 chain-length determining protein [Massilia sp. WG5]KLU37682.1 chain-length determining protein [Massilia sp. WF1]